MSKTKIGVKESFLIGHMRPSRSLFLEGINFKILANYVSPGNKSCLCIHDRTLKDVKLQSCLEI